MRTTTIINGKGGVGKTTTTHALATGLPRQYKALAIDYDPQGNLSLAYGADVNGSPTMYHVIGGEITLQEAIQHTEQGDILVGNTSLSKIEKMFVGEDYLEGIGKLRELLAPLTDTYTHVFIDNQPLIGGLLTMQTLAAATDLVVPMSAETFAVQGFSRLQKAIESIRGHFNPGLRMDGILLTKYNPRTIIASHIRETIVKWAEAFDTRVYDATIREGVSVREAQAKHQSLFAYAPYSNPALDYGLFIKEYLGREA